MQWSLRIKFKKKSSNRVRLTLRLKWLLTKNCSNLKNFLRNNHSQNNCSHSLTTLKLLSKEITNSNNILSTKCSILIKNIIKISQSRAWIRSMWLLRWAHCITTFLMGLLLSTIKIVKINTYHLKVLVSSIMGNYTTHLLVVSQEMDGHYHFPRCTMGDQQMEATSLSSNQIGTQIM